MGLASGLILDSQINASDHLGELIVKKKKSLGMLLNIPSKVLQFHFFFFASHDTL